MAPQPVSKTAKQKDTIERRPIPERALEMLEQRVNGIQSVFPLEMEVLEGKLGVAFLSKNEEDQPKDHYLAGPFYHGDSARGWIDGFWQACVIKNKQAAEETKKRNAENQRKEVHIVCTGNFYHLHTRNPKYQKWERVEHQKNPAYNMANALELAVELYGKEGFYLAASENKVV